MLCLWSPFEFSMSFWKCHSLGVKILYKETGTVNIVCQLYLMLTVNQHIPEPWCDHNMLTSATNMQNYTIKHLTATCLASVISFQILQCKLTGYEGEENLT